MTETQSIQIVERHAQPAISLRVTTPREQIAPTFEMAIPRLWNHLTSQGAVPSGPLFACYHGYTDEAFDVEIGFPLSAEIAGDGEIRMSQQPGGRMASFVHFGPYEELPAAWQSFLGRMREEGMRPTGPCCEIYLNDPGEEPDSSKWQTELLNGFEQSN